jgi:hypothetical protein
MTYFHRFKGFIFIALACFCVAQGSAVNFVQLKSDLQKNDPASVYTVSVSASQSNSQASAKLKMSGENSKVSVEKEGTVTLVASKSILLLPGTKITAGGFLYASIEQSPAKGGKHRKKAVKLVTIEENKKIEEQATLSFAYTLFNPFPAPGRRQLHAGAAENGSFISSGNELVGVSTDQQRKVAVDSRPVEQGARKQTLFNVNPVQVACGHRAETMRVLRL